MTAIQTIKWKLVFKDIFYLFLIALGGLAPLLALMAFVEFTIFDGVNYEKIGNAQEGDTLEIVQNYMIFINIFWITVFFIGFYRAANSDPAHKLQHMVCIATIIWLIGGIDLLSPHPDIMWQFYNFVTVFGTMGTAFIIRERL